MFSTDAGDVRSFEGGAAPGRKLDAVPEIAATAEPATTRDARETRRRRAPLVFPFYGSLSSRLVSTRLVSSCLNREASSLAGRTAVPAVLAALSTLASLGAGGAAPAWAQPALVPAAAPAASVEMRAVAAELQAEALGGDGAWELVSSLVTEVGPRFAGSPGDAAARAWAEAKLRALGFPKVWSEPVTVPRWVRGEERGAIVSPWPQPVTLAALGGSVGTPAGGIEAEVVGVDSLEALAALPDAAVAGRIVFVQTRMFRHPDGAGYGAAVPMRTRGASEASRKGAVAVLIRSVGTDPHRLPHTGTTRYAEGVVPIPAVALSAPDADLLEQQLASGRPVRFRLELGSRMDGEAESANVLAEMPGSGSPEEIVLVAAHLDSWDITPGAQDNGTGVALAIEAARLAAGASPGGKPKRTIRVWLTANEEFGLSGARAYVVAHEAEADRHVLATEADSGSGRVLRFTTRFAPEDEAAAKELAALLLPLGVPKGEGEADGGADLSRLTLFGVPLVDLRVDASRYFDVHHTANDTLLQVDREALRQSTASLATVLWWAANREARPAPVEKRAPRF
jgi:hypothetical protein